MSTEPILEINTNSGVMPKGSEEDYWRAVETRDPRYYSSFVFAVRSTGVYCRPTCPSRRPSRDRIEFYSTPKSARDAGFRACLRCRPDELQMKSGQVQAVERACNFMDQNYNSKIRLSLLAEIANQSPFYFHRTFKRVMGITPRQYLEAVRLKHLKLSLKQGESTRRSTYKVGYNTAGWLYSERDSKIGVMPSDYKSGGQGLVIAYNISDCNLGRILVAATSRGVCFVCLGNSDGKLINYLSDEYPKATIISEPETDIQLQEWVSQILQYLEGKNKLLNSNLPIDVQATAFQWKVWKELQNIPYGTTRSYNDIANRVGVPRGYRAVANACASNRVPLAIPCHRVVRKNGDLGGYRWGVERKKKLLQLEKTVSN
ncbi:MAG: bifunctional DNA-binding transcriptional regulator/O6-methylguanine-DNA methyltransferase Ada [Thaumarchaeota archaeon]|nr:bifunctional DNA-binding transcriptional regulator/O6-methylguanine-DNA methyltransferase Ada [Nitrososphaerota archaeon]